MTSRDLARPRDHECAHGHICRPLVVAAGQLDDGPHDYIIMSAETENGPRTRTFGCAWCWARLIVDEGSTIVGWPHWRQMLPLS